MAQPAPFIIQALPDGSAVASNGATEVICTEPDAQMFRRRGVRGLPAGPIAEKMLPQLNLLAGELVSQPAMPQQELRARLHVLMSLCDQPEPQNVEACVAQVGDVRVYVQQGRVIVSRQNVLV